MVNAIAGEFTHMSVSVAPLTPANTITVTVSATSAAVALPTPVGNQIVVTSLAANAIAFIALGISTTTVVIPTGTKQNGFPILPGTANVFTVGDYTTHIATIGTAANTLYISCGDGA